MKGLAILLLVVLFFALVWPKISKWLQRKAMEKVQDYVFSSMGMPPRKKKKRWGKDQSEKEEESQQTFYRRERRNPFGPDRYTDEPIIPKEYAEDVEFEETKEFSNPEIGGTETKREETYHESQISDVEYTEIKKPRTK